MLDDVRPSPWASSVAHRASTPVSVAITSPRLECPAARRGHSGRCRVRQDDYAEKVVENEIGAGELFATILEAAGIDSSKEYHVGARPIPLVNPGIKPIKEVLA